MSKGKSTVSWKRVVGASALISLAVLAIWHYNAPRTSAQGGFAGAIFTVSAASGGGTTTSAATTTDLKIPTTPGPFTQQGTISSVNGGGGTFYRTGTVFTLNVFDPGNPGSPKPTTVAIVNDVYDMASFDGVIVASGILRGVAVGRDTPGVDAASNIEFLPVIGGVGTYRGVNGELQLTQFSSTDGSFKAFLQENVNTRLWHIP